MYHQNNNNYYLLCEPRLKFFSILFIQVYIAFSEAAKPHWIFCEPKFLHIIYMMMAWLFGGNQKPQSVVVS